MNDLPKLLSIVLGFSESNIQSVDYSSIFRLAQAHGVANMIYHALPYLPQEAQPEESVKRKLKELAFAASARDAIQTQEWETLKAAFEDRKLFVLPLKGCMIREIYPKQGIRYMSDTDLVIKPDQAGAVKTMMEELGYKALNYDHGKTDIYISPMGMNYEVHRSIKTEGYGKKSKEYLEHIMTHARPMSGMNYVLSIPYEEHYAYLLCHFIKHLLYGGIGVRQVMDIYVCRTRWEFDEIRLKEILAEWQLTKFSITIERLAYHWFGGGEADALTEEFGTYVLGSGIFGKEEQRVADRMILGSHGKNKFTYIWTRLFPPYKTMCYYYPILKKWGVLLPIFWLWRIIYAGIFRRKKLAAEIGAVGESNAQAVRQRANFYKRCGIDISKK